MLSFNLNIKEDLFLMRIYLPQLKYNKNVPMKNIKFSDHSGFNMALRREIISYLGMGAIGGVIGYYAGVKELLGIQSQEKESVDNNTPAETETESGSTTETDTADQSESVANRRFSFEEATAGTDQLPAPWTVIQDPTSDGFNSVEISEQHATDGTQTLHMSGNGELDRILVGFTADMSDIDTVRCDIYIERANVGVGEIFFGKWDGESTKIIPFLGATGGEGQSRFDSTGQFTDVEGDLADLSGEHEILFNVRGDNEAYFDNLRFITST